MKQGAHASQEKKATTGWKAELARLEARLQKRQQKLEKEIAEFRVEMKAAVGAATHAAEMRVLNERLATEGLARLRGELQVMREKGIIDEKGKRIRKPLPAEMLRSAPCDV